MINVVIIAIAIWLANRFGGGSRENFDYKPA
jgi:hypothetical protein